MAKISFQNVEKDALSLSESDRTQLVLTLLESIEKDTPNDPQRVEAKWLEEANRRYEAYKAGEEQAIPAEQVFAELRTEDH